MRVAVKTFGTMLAIGIVLAAVFRGPIWHALSPRATSPYATIAIPEASYEVRAEVARTTEDRVRGLSGRDALATGTGMLFVFDMLDQHRMWMRDMRFSIDIIWIAGGVVVDTHENLPVPSPDVDPATLPYFNPRPQALFALEVPAGDVATHRIVPGQRVNIMFDVE